MPRPAVNVAVRAARAAGQIILRYMNRLDSLEVIEKQRHDYVSEVDRLAEAEIIRELKRAYPRDAVLAEESGASGAGRNVWVIDPLDGTHNYLRGFPHFSVSIGLLEGGEPTLGVVYDPLRDEMFLAEKDRGAYLNGKRIHVSPTATIAESLIATGFPSRKRHGNPNVHFYHEVTLRSHGVRRAGSAALDLAYTACGRLDGYWEFKLNSWDTAAGVLLVREGGGLVTYVDGGAFHLVSAEVLATNGKIHEQLIHLFQDMFAGRNLEPIPTPREFAATRNEGQPTRS